MNQKPHANQFRKFIRAMIENGILQEFGFSTKITKLDIDDVDLDGETVDFAFESIFEDCRVYGYLDIYGKCNFVTTEGTPMGTAYGIVKGYFSNI